MEIRRFQPGDAVETAQMIAKALIISNSKDYSGEYIDIRESSRLSKQRNRAKPISSDRRLSV